MATPPPGESKKKGAAFKAVWLLGKLQGVLYVIKGFLDHTTNEEFINWFFLLNEYVGGKTNLYCMVENNKASGPVFPAGAETTPGTNPQKEERTAFHQAG